MFKSTLIQDHKRPSVDGIFGIKNTESWKNAVSEIRKSALIKLWSELNAQDSIQKKIELLANAREMPIFNDHINNSFLFGAFGRTQTVCMIDDKLDQLLLNLNMSRKTGNP